MGCLEAAWRLLGGCLHNNHIIGVVRFPIFPPNNPIFFSFLSPRRHHHYRIIKPSSSHPSASRPPSNRPALAPPSIQTSPLLPLSAFAFPFFFNSFWPCFPAPLARARLLELLLCRHPPTTTPKVFESFHTRPPRAPSCCPDLLPPLLSSFAVSIRLRFLLLLLLFVARCHVRCDCYQAFSSHRAPGLPR